MQPILKINLESYKKIIWPLVLLVFLQMQGVSNKMLFLIQLAYIGIIILSGRKIIIPKITGITPYFIFVIYSVVVGLIMYQTRSVARDIYYILPTIVIIVLGYYYYIIEGKNNKSIEATIIIISLIYSLNCFSKALSDMSIIGDFDQMKTVFSNGVYEVTLGCIILFYYIFFTRKVVFTRIIDRLIFSILFMNIVMSMSRIAIIEGVTGIVVIGGIYAWSNKDFWKIIKRVGLIIITIILVITIGTSLLPSEAREKLTEKFEKSFEEIDSEQEFVEVDDAMANWRGYEIYSVQQQWIKSNVLVRFFGAGLGKGVELELIPYTWEDMVENGEIPLLHNGFYTLLPKGGIIAVIAVLWFFLQTIYMGIKMIKTKKFVDNGILIVCISIMMIVNMYVVRGIVAQNVGLVFPLLVGWTNAKIRRQKSV